MILATSSAVLAVPAVVSLPPPEPTADAAAPRTLQDIRQLVPAVFGLPSNPGPSPEVLELRDAAAWEAAARRAAEAGQHVEPPATSTGRPAAPATPFGNVPTAARPGEILPVPPNAPPPSPPR